MPNQQAQLSLVFSALADPTRRGVLTRLGTGEATVSQLAEPYAMALPSFTQHLRVLEECGLVKSEKRGRSRVYGLVPRRLRIAESWLERQRTLWERRLDGPDDYLVEMKQKER